MLFSMGFATGFVCLVVTVVAIAQTAPKEYCVTIGQQKTLDKAVSLCPEVRKLTPPERQTPWTGDDCAREAMLIGFKVVNAEVNELGLKLALRNNDATSDLELEVTPEPVATPTATPTAMP